MSRTAINESDILERVISASSSPMSVDAATALLGLKFPEKDTNRIRSLLKKNNAGRISAEERVALEQYLRVGRFLDILHAKARTGLSENVQVN